MTLLPFPDSPKDDNGETSPRRRSRVAISPAQQKVLFVASAGQCAFPGCPIRGIVEASGSSAATVLVEIAHIHAYEDGGPRADRSLSLEERNRYPNLIVMCPTHHALIDKQPAAYPAELLRSWKLTTERAVQSALLEAMPRVDFLELELVTRSILAMQGSISSDYQVLAPAAKMQKNGLSGLTGGYLRIALAKADEVGRFVEQFSLSDGEFGSRLRAGFVNEYNELRASGLQGDELFSELLIFACGNRRGTLPQAAGLAVLGYFFGACEVFEK